MIQQRHFTYPISIKLFSPLKTNKFLIEHGEQQIKEYIDKCTNNNQETFSFAPQIRVFASKTDNHLRRTVKLDVISEYFIYDIIYKNRALFRPPHGKNRANFGYRFENGEPVNPTKAYKAFKGAISEYSKTYKHFISTDIASYFNNIYHHDIINWFTELGAPDSDSGSLGQMLRQINSGRSVDCLPQGLYPAKMIGNAFLRFLENSHRLKSEILIRFMDDIYLFSNSEKSITDDFITIQTLLGHKGLSLNPRKTNRETSQHAKVEDDIDDIKQKLLQKRRLIITSSYLEDDNALEIMFKNPLTKEELKYVDKILENPNLEEDDAELLLAILITHTEKIETRLESIIEKFPNLSKNIYKFCFLINDKEYISDIIYEILSKNSTIHEFQLFWFAVMLEEYLMNTKKAPHIMDKLYKHNSSTTISKAKILEIQDRRYGLPELQEEILREGHSSWLGWAAATGVATMHKRTKNHNLKYFGSCSNINNLIAKVIGSV